MEEKQSIRFLQLKDTSLLILWMPAPTWKNVSAMISGFTNCRFLGNDDQLFNYEEEAPSRRCHVRAWYYECFDFVAGRCPCPLGNAALGEKEDPLINSMKAVRVQGLVPSIQSEAVTSELQELSLHPAPEPVPLQERKNGETVQHSHFWLSRA